MSTKVMAKCWPIQCTPTQKSVLIALADQANDDGVCWPSVGTIVERTCLCERVVRRVIAELEKVSLVRADRVSGKSTSYTVTPALHAPLHDVHPCTTSRTPLHVVHPTPARGAPPYTLNRKGTVIEPAGFEEFWKAYPRKKSKGDAEKAWRALKPDEHLQESILNALRIATTSEDWLKDSGKWIPYPATWIRGKRWTDDEVSSANDFAGNL